MSKLTFASVISEIQQSDIYMTVKARICEAPEANLNGARVTEAFIDEIVGNEERYVGLPLYADKKALLSGDYNRLGHLYDERTGEFHSTQIGSFYKFEKQKFDIVSLVGKQSGCALIGYARIPKRNKKLSKAISELFADGNLKFSFELSVGEYEELDDNTILIDASENNYLEGTAIVTFPACEEAVALELVAQRADETRKGDEEMAEVENKAEVVETEAAQPELAEEKKAEEATETVAEEIACKDKKNAEEENSEEVACEENACKNKKTAEENEQVEACKDKKQAEEQAENAEVYVRETHVERVETCAFDDETGKDIHQAVTVETTSSQAVEGTLVEANDGIHIAEKQEEDDNTVAPIVDAPAEQTEQTQETGEVDQNASAKNNSDDSGDSAPEVVAENKAEQMIAELLEVVNSLKAEIAELKEAKTVTAEINPFMSNISVESKYSLLEKEDKVTSYSLLSK